MTHCFKPWMALSRKFLTFVNLQLPSKSLASPPLITSVPLQPSPPFCVLESLLV